MIVADKKREQIIDGAIKRFIHFGIGKTTMNDIAEDLSVSKPSLYYYFPDKSQLYIAVMRKLATEYLKTLESRLNTFTNLKEAFTFQVNTHHEFIVNNYNFFDFFRLNEQNLPETIWQIVGEVHSAELSLLSNAIKTEVERGAIKPVENPEEIVDVLMDALHGIRVGAISQKKTNFPRKEHLEEIHTKKLLLLDIFIRGLMY